MAHYSSPLLFMRTEHGESTVYSDRHPSWADKVQHKVGWILQLNVYNASGNVSFLYRPDQTRHASAVRLLFLLSLVELFQLQNHPLRNLYGSRNDANDMLRLYSPPYASVDPEISSSSLPPAARRAFCSFIPPFLFVPYASVVQIVHASFRVFVNALLALPLLYHHPLFFRVFSFPIIWAAVLLVIDAYDHTSSFLWTLQHCLCIRSLHIPLPLPLCPPGSVSFPLASLVDCGFRVLL